MIEALINPNDPIEEQNMFDTHKISNAKQVNRARNESMT